MKKFKSSEYCGPPTEIISDGKEGTSPAKLSKIFNSLFDKKIETIIKGFKEIKEENKELLLQLVEKQKTEFDIESVTTTEIYNAITQMNDVGTAKAIKMIPHITSLWLMHVMILMLMKGRFPKILKISRIFPILTPNKNQVLTSRYRPICNLPVYEKVIEEVVKKSKIPGRD